MGPAAFGRLCVETASASRASAGWYQPPSGGCVLKLAICFSSFQFFSQPPSGGCVLKPPLRLLYNVVCGQPPSCGCVLKLPIRAFRLIWFQPAAFGRLCVETFDCVFQRLARAPAAFGRLCVETLIRIDLQATTTTSRLRAAVC